MMILTVAPSLSTWTWMGMIVLAILQLIVLVRRLLTPVSQVPGPFLTKISYVPIFAYDQRSERTAWTRRLHDKYGPVVRISPGEVSVASATGIRDVFSGSPASGGAYPKSKLFELFKHFGARNSFTSITSAQHGWRRKVIGSSYSQSAVLARETATGNIWRIAGNYIRYIEDNGIPVHGNVAARSVDVHTANTYFAGDGVSSYVLLNGLEGLPGNEKHRRLIIATQEKPADVLSYFHQEYRDFFNWLNLVKAFFRSLIPGCGPQLLSERTRVGDKDPKKLNSIWYGGTEYRDYTYHSYLDAKAKLKSIPQALNHGPITMKLASNVVTGEQIQQTNGPIVEDPSMRGFQSQRNFHKDAGAASEAMDHLIAGQDTTSETLSHALQALSILQNHTIQVKLRSEILSLDLPFDHGRPLNAEQLATIMKASYLDAVIKETLRLYPPHTTNIHRNVPSGGRVLDDWYLPGGTKVGTSAYIVHMNGEIFGRDVESWIPERWLLEDQDQVRKMEHALWAFGSGPRGCVGKHLAMVEMKILLSSLYRRYSTVPDELEEVPLESNRQHAQALAIGKLACRERIKLDIGWTFQRTETNPDGLTYDMRTGFPSTNDTWALKPWILPSVNDFIKDPANFYLRPDGNPGSDVPFVQSSFDDSRWETVTLPHDCAIQGPFYSEEDPIVSSSMGRLPVYGVGWRSTRLDLTPYVNFGRDKQLAIRLENPTDSARWYPGAGLYRNVWLTKVDSTHVAQWGTYVISNNVSAQSATLDLTVQVENTAATERDVEVMTDVYLFDPGARVAGEKVAEFTTAEVNVPAGQTQAISGSVTIRNPRLWGTIPAQQPNLYVAVTQLLAEGKVIDTYETTFGVRSLAWDPDAGLLVNGELIKLQGVNMHHDLGSLGAAFNVRAAERRLELLQDLGCNAIRMSHNPPAVELLELTDQMGILVLDEIFDTWEYNKTAADFHLIFPDWHEADLRSFLRRDRNHASIIGWSYGNEVYEQYTNETGAALSEALRDILREEDSTRLSTASANYATPDLPFPRVLDMISLNYQGSGIRDTNAYSELRSKGIYRLPSYPPYHAMFPEKPLFSSETASALSSRGVYYFPVVKVNSAPANDTSGGNSEQLQISAYELYTAGPGSSADKVFTAQDENPYVAGEFVWTGWDYLGEPTPYDGARSSYYGIIDLAGFKKDRFYIYQAHWRPDIKMAHILPHWTWPYRVGQVTPVHVFSAGDEAELFVNGKSQGRIQRQAYEYRFRWDEVVYQAGEVSVITYKDGKEWARDVVRTAGEAVALELEADRTSLTADGLDLSFITVKVVDSQGNLVPEANNTITFSLTGPGDIVATDNGDATDLTPFTFTVRDAFSGLAQGTVRGRAGVRGEITVTASTDGLQRASIVLEAH